MRSNNTAMLFRVLLGLVITLLFGCGKKQDGEIWKEEVRLMNGELIIADMKNRYGDSGDVSLRHGPLTWAEIQFDYKGRHYKWGERGVAPMALQIDAQGRFYIVSTIPYCWAWQERGGNSYYVIFRYEGDRWRQVPLDAIDVHTVFNLAGSSQLPGSSEFKPYLKETDWKYKDDYFIPNREIVPTKKPSC